MAIITATEFQRNPGRYQDDALQAPVVITKNKRERLVLLSVEEYRKLKRTAHAPGGKPDMGAGAGAKMPAADAKARTVQRQRIRAERAIAAQASKIPAIDTVIEFGSRARRDDEPFSDIDIAVSCPDATPDEWVRIYHALQDAETLLVIDMHRLGDVSADLRSRIDSEGRVIYER